MGEKGEERKRDSNGKAHEGILEERHKNAS